jgi:hypothetical protein
MVKSLDENHRPIDYGLRKTGKQDALCDSLTGNERATIDRRLVSR